MEEIEEIMEEDEYITVDLEYMRQRIVEFASGRVIFIGHSFEIIIKRNRSGNLHVELIKYQDVFDSPVTGRWVYTTLEVFSGEDLAKIAEKVYSYFDRITTASTDLVHTRYVPDRIKQEYYIEVRNLG